MITKPTRPTEVITVPNLGTVVVRGMLLTEREALLRAAGAESRMAFVISVLAATVLDEETGEQALTREEWDVFAGQYQEEALRVFERALVLAGLSRDQQDPKASAQIPS